jgi:hypothetical protein
LTNHLNQTSEDDSPTEGNHLEQLEKFIPFELLSEMKSTREEGREWTGSGNAIALFTTWRNMKNSVDDGESQRNFLM